MEFFNDECIKEEYPEDYEFTEKDIKEAIDFGGFYFARENLAILDNLERAHASIKNDPALKNNKDLFDRDYKFEIIKIDENYPKFLRENKNKYKSWIL